MKYTPNKNKAAAAERKHLTSLNKLSYITFGAKINPNYNEINRLIERRDFLKSKLGPGAKSEILDTDKINQTINAINDEIARLEDEAKRADDDTIKAYNSDTSPKINWKQPNEVVNFTKPPSPPQSVGGRSFKRKSSRKHKKRSNKKRSHKRR